MEEAAGATISLTTPKSTESVTITAKSGGSITLKTSTTTVTMDSSGTSVKTTSCKVQATDVKITAPSVTVNSPLTTFNGVVKALVVQTPSVVAQSYTPGIGNIW